METESQQQRPTRLACEGNRIQRQHQRLLVKDRRIVQGEAKEEWLSVPRRRRWRRQHEEKNMKMWLLLLTVLLSHGNNNIQSMEERGLAFPSLVVATTTSSSAFGAASFFGAAVKSVSAFSFMSPYSMLGRRQHHSISGGGGRDARISRVFVGFSGNGRKGKHHKKKRKSAAADTEGVIVDAEVETFEIDRLRLENKELLSAFSDAEAEKERLLLLQQQQQNGEGEADEDQVAVEVRLEGDDGMVRRLVVPRSEAAYTVLQRTALEMSHGLTDSDEFAGCNCGIRLRYTDASGKKVEIGSRKEWLRSVNEHAADEGIFAVVASTVVIKLYVAADGETGNVCRRITANMQPSVLFTKLKKEAVCFETGSKDEDEVSLRGYDVRFNYTDKDGDIVCIGSGEELEDAMRQFLDSGTIKITAAVKVDETVTSVARDRDAIAQQDSLQELVLESLTAKLDDFESQVGTLKSTVQDCSKKSDRKLDQLVRLMKSEPEEVKEVKEESPPLRAFTSLRELERAVDAYLSDNSPDSPVAQTYGHPIGIWNVSLVTSFNGVFSAERNAKAAEFNEDLSHWDVSNGKDFNYMFKGAFKFAGDLSSWDMSSAESAWHMFREAKNFNGDLSNWDVSKMREMIGMFELAGSFQGDLSSWDVSGCTTMWGMFSRASKFNSDLSNWDVSNVTDMRIMFYKASSFKSDVRNWNVSKVTKVENMFGGVEGFRDQVRSWDLSGAADKDAMFSS